MNIRAVMRSDRDWVTCLVVQHFGTAHIISRGVDHDSRSLPGLIAERQGERVGLILYRISDRRCEVVAIVVLHPRQGTGRRLLGELSALARARACRCLWLVTTNDNRSAQQFYAALGWRLVAVHRGAIAASRRLKPEIPERSPDGTPIEDELEYEFDLDSPQPSAAGPSSLSV